MTFIGPFSTLFEKGELDVPAYLTLLHFGRDAHVAVERVRRALESPDAGEKRLGLFEQLNWRPHLVGAIAILIDGGRPEDIAAMWLAIDRGSWVSPQLAAAASLRDPRFVETSRERIRTRCLLVEHPSDLVTTDRNPKTLSALLALGAELPELADECASARLEADVIAVLREDRDHGGDIALDWKNAVESIVAGAATSLR